MDYTTISIKKNLAVDIDEIASNENLTKNELIKKLLDEYRAKRIASRKEAFDKMYRETSSLKKIIGKKIKLSDILETEGSDSYYDR